MTAYVIVEIEVTDPVEYERYKSLASAAVAQYGGQYLARGGKTLTLEGDWSPGRMVILGFESLEQAERWWNSPEYSEAKAIRQSASRSKMLVVEGVPPAS
jgi:uncharacterized protein (DUF1330 family)